MKRTVRVAALLMIVSCKGDGNPLSLEALASGVVLEPLAVQLTAGDTVRFHATATSAEGSNLPLQPVWEASGGTIDAAGLYRAGTAPGAFSVTASFPATTLAATAAVTVMPPGRQLVGINLLPASATLLPGDTIRFSTLGVMSDGTQSPVAASYAATGGSISAAGLFTAGSQPGAFRVIATESGTGTADTSAVTINARSGTLARVILTPPSVTLQTGATAQFQVTGELTDGSTAPVAVSYTATGGSISASGLYTAGSTAGSYRVIATATSANRADTSSVTITAPSPAPAPPPPPSGNYTTVIGDDWRSYSSKAQLQARQYFWWYLTGQDVYQYVDLAQDPLMGQVARITFPQTDQVGFAPKMSVNFGKSLDKMWYRWKMRWSPGWTSAGPNPPGHANSYKLAFWYWEAGFGGRGQLELSNTSQYIAGIGVTDASTGQAIRYSETVLPGSASSFGSITTEWSDDEWWEYVVYYNKTGPTSADQHYWRRRYSQGGRVAPGPWTYIGFRYTGATTPRTTGIALGETKNKSNPSTMYIWWGPWEVVDGSQYSNPFGMPNVP